MTKPISAEMQQKVLEAHKLGLSEKKTAERVGVAKSVVQKYWRAAELKPHFEIRNLCLPKETQDLIYTAWELGLSARKAGRYLGIYRRTVLRYWRAAGLPPHHAAWAGARMGFKVPLEVLLDNVFDTATNPDEQLELEQIVGRLKNRLGTEKINTGYLKKQINRLVSWGCYAIMQDGGKIYYKAGMPSAMDGNLKAAIEK